MLKKVFCRIMLTLLLTGMLALTFNIQPVKGFETIYIEADGSVSPPTAPIERNGNIYTFTDNIEGSIIIEVGLIIIDGVNYTLQGMKEVGSCGFFANGLSGVTIKNTHITGFWKGIDIYGPVRDWNIFQNDITVNMIGISACHYFHDSIITENQIVNNNNSGIQLSLTSEYNTITKNVIANSTFGIVFEGGISGSGYNVITQNDITYNEYGLLIESSHNTIVHNNFINNSNQASTAESLNNTRARFQ